MDYASSDSGSLGLAFPKSKKWIGRASDSSNGGFEGPDGALNADIYFLQRSRQLCGSRQQTKRRIPLSYTFPRGGRGNDAFHHRI